MSTNRTRSHEVVNALSQLVAERVAADPTLVDRAREQLPRLEGRSPYATRWAALLDAGADECINVLTATDAETQPLRSDSPFALIEGLIPEQTRLAVIDAIHLRRRGQQ